MSGDAHERDFQRKAVAYLRELPDVAVVNIHGGGWTAKGCPDLLCCIKGGFVAFELKVGSNGLSPAQRVWMRRIKKAGGRYHIPYSMDELKRIVAAYLEEGGNGRTDGRLQVPRKKGR